MTLSGFSEENDVGGTGARQRPQSIYFWHSSQPQTHKGAWFGDDDDTGSHTRAGGGGARAQGGGRPTLLFDDDAGSHKSVNSDLMVLVMTMTRGAAKVCGSSPDPVRRRAGSDNRRAFEKRALGTKPLGGTHNFH